MRVPNCTSAPKLCAPQTHALRGSSLLSSNAIAYRHVHVLVRACVKKAYPLALAAVLGIGDEPLHKHRGSNGILWRLGAE
jgi:hypothetical protein